VKLTVGRAVVFVSKVRISTRRAWKEMTYISRSASFMRFSYMMWHDLFDALKGGTLCQDGGGLTWAVKNDFGRERRGCFERIFAMVVQDAGAAPYSHTAWARRRDSMLFGGARLVVLVVILLVSPEN
jgi:hypothetical protein